MNQGYRRNPNPFWRVAGPFLGYLAIQWGVQFLIQLVIQLPYMAHAYAEVLRTAGSMTTQEMMDTVIKAMAPALEKALAYQVEAAGLSALATLILSGILFSRDRKRERICAAGAAGAVGTAGSGRAAEAGGALAKAGVSAYGLLPVFGIAGSLAATSLMAMAQMAFLDAQYQETAQRLYSAGIPMQILVLGVIVPLSEEMMFRGVLFRRFRERQPFWYAALYSALLFSLMHTSMTQMLYTFLLGLMLAYVYEKYGSFKAPFLLHLSVNTASVVFTALGVFAWLAEEPVRIAAAAIIGSFLCSVLFVLIQKTGTRVSGGEKSGQNGLY